MRLFGNPVSPSANFMIVTIDDDKKRELTNERHVLCQVNKEDVAVKEEYGKKKESLDDILTKKQILIKHKTIIRKIVERRINERNVDGQLRVLLNDTSSDNNLLALIDEKNEELFRVNEEKEKLHEIIQHQDELLHCRHMIIQEMDKVFDFVLSKNARQVNKNGERFLEELRPFTESMVSFSGFFNMEGTRIKEKNNKVDESDDLKVTEDIPLTERDSLSIEQGCLHQEKVYNSKYYPEITSPKCHPQKIENIISIGIHQHENIVRCIGDRDNIITSDLKQVQKRRFLKGPHEAIKQILEELPSDFKKYILITDKLDQFDRKIQFD